MNSNETIADIVSCIRDIAQSYRNGTIRVNSITIEGLKVCDELERIADRIEAAWKRECDKQNERDNESFDIRATFALKQLGGNMVAIREALVRSTTRLKGICDCFPEVRDMIKEQIEENKTALSAKPRNCDRFADGVTAYHTFADETKSGMCEPAYLAVMWLFAPTAEEKGDGDGSK